MRAFEGRPRGITLVEGVLRNAQRSFFFFALIGISVRYVSNQSFSLQRQQEQKLASKVPFIEQIAMEVSSSVNKMALKQLDLAADRIGLDLKCAGQTQPARSCFDCEDSNGQRNRSCIHGLPPAAQRCFGSLQGGIRYHPEVNLGEVSALECG